MRVFVRWGWVRLLSKAVACTPVLCCAWVCLSLWGSGWCFFNCCGWRGCAPLSCFLSSSSFFLAGSAPTPAHPSPTLLDLPFFGVVFLCVGVGKPQSCRSSGVCRVVACFVFPCVGVCTYLPLLSPQVVFLCVPPELFSCGSGTCLLCIGGRVSLFRRLGCVCAALFSCVFRCCNGCARGRRGRACFHALGVGSVLCVGWLWGWCCAWVVVPLPVGLVLFVGVLVGDVRRFVVSFFPLPTPKSPPSHSIGFARVRGRFPVCSAVCVLFARWGG